MSDTFTDRFLGILLAAGEGTRMRSNLPKVLHKIGGLSMVGHVIRAFEGAGCENLALVVGNQAEKVSQECEKLSSRLISYIQNERLGTAHAVLAAQESFKDGKNHIIIGYGDTPLVTAELFNAIKDALLEGADIAVLGFESDNPHGYGRLVMNGEALIAIREEKDANDEERAIKFCNSGIMGLRGKHAHDILRVIGNNNAKGEYYLTDAVEIAHAKGLKVRAVIGKEEETLGVNNRYELSNAEAIFQRRKRKEFMLSGVTLQAPETTFFSYDTEIGADSVIEPNCFFAPGVCLAENVTIKANSYLEGDVVNNKKVSIASEAIIGPFARLRPGSLIGEKVKVGNFCEIKNAQIEKGAKVNHLTYIGDAEIGAGANIGAGTITCNYDGYSKYKTIIGQNAFIGSNSSLVAPITIESGAYIGSGSVVTKNVEKDALAVARGKLRIISGWAEVFRGKKIQK